MRIPFSDFGAVPKPGETWGLNICREAPSTGELSYWAPTGGKFTRIRGIGDLVFVKGRDAAAPVSDVRLEEQGPGAYILRAKTKSPRAVKRDCTSWVQTPGDAVSRKSHPVEVAPGDGHLAIPVTFEATEEGEAKLWFTIQDRETQVTLAYGAYSFQVVLPSEASFSKTVLVPEPKEFKLTEGEFGIDEGTILQTGSDKSEAFIADLIRDEIQTYYGVAIPEAVRDPIEKALLIGRPETSPALRDALDRCGLLGRLKALKPEGYVLVVGPKRVLLAGRDARGTHYAARTFLQLVSGATMEGQVPRALCGTVVDWPDFPFRGYMVSTGGWVSDPVDPDILKEHIRKEIAGYKYNTILWRVKGGYKYERWPRLTHRCALSRDTYRELVRFARAHSIDVMPGINVHGHANWIGLKYPEFREDGDYRTLCTRHPKTYELITDVIEELLDAFDRPKRFHVGLDEVRWQTLNVPEEKRCVRCKGVPKWKLFADHVTRLHGILRARNVEMWMWADMLVRRHNGRAPFDCYKALGLIPKDIVLCNWSASYAPGSCRELEEKGFRVVRGNSREVPLVDAPHVVGNLASFWHSTPWRTITHIGQWGVAMDTAYGANFSWNVNRESISLRRYLRGNDINVLRSLARARLPRARAGCRPVELSSVVNRAVTDEEAGDGKGWADLGPEQDLRALPAGRIVIGPVNFQTVPGGDAASRAVFISSGSGEPVEIPIARRAASLIFLHTLILPADEKGQKAFFKRFLRPPVEVPITNCRVSFTDGKSQQVAICAGREAGNWLPKRNAEYLHHCPYIYRLATEKARRTTPGATDIVLYVYEWPNKTGKEIASIQLSHTGTEADYALLALSTRDVAEGRTP